eukprot:scaffold69_cov248-Pinguiococcus_pyrenoidosus.AAC.8
MLTTTPNQTRRAQAYQGLIEVDHHRLGRFDGGSAHGGLLDLRHVLQDSQQELHAALRAQKIR